MDATKRKTEQNRLPTNDGHKALIDIYNQQVPELLKTYQDGVKAGIRYALIAMGKKIEGINCEKEGGGYGEKHVR